MPFCTSGTFLIVMVVLTNELRYRSWGTEAAFSVQLCAVYLATRQQTTVVQNDSRKQE